MSDAFPPGSPVEHDAVLVLESDSVTGRHLAGALRSWGYEPFLTGSVDEALDALASGRFVATLLGRPGQGDDDLEILRQRRLNGMGGRPVVLITDPRDFRRVAEAISLGADEVIHQPLDLRDLEGALRDVLARSRPSASLPTLEHLEPEVRLRQEVALWQSPRMQELWNVVQRAAQADVTVLIGGETGSGKDVVARSIHLLSARRLEPFVKVNCAAVPRELLESELFGHERGAFTGAHQLKIGKFEAAHRGVVFLDEIGDLHLALQSKLLHVLQDGILSRLGGKSALKVDVRVLAATNTDLERAVVERRFREDLYYRLNVIQIVVPPLRERLEEVPILADYFVRRYARQFRRGDFAIHPVAMERLRRHRYPGNVRELENIVKRMIVLNDPMLAKSAPAADGDGNGDHIDRTAPRHDTVSLREIGRAAARAAEREAISRVLGETRWNRVRAAKLLRISYRALLYKIREVGLDAEQPYPRTRTGR